MWPLMSLSWPHLSITHFTTLTYVYLDNQSFLSVRLSVAGGRSVEKKENKGGAWLDESLAYGLFIPSPFPSTKSTNASRTWWGWLLCKTKLFYFNEREKKTHKNQNSKPYTDPLERTCFPQNSKQLQDCLHLCLEALKSTTMEPLLLLGFSDADRL